MKYKLAVLINLSERTTYEVNKKTFSYFLKELNEIYFLDLSKLMGSDPCVNIQEDKDKVIMIQPKTIDELKNIFKKNNFIYMYCINTSLKYFVYFKTNFFITNTAINAPINSAII